MRPDISIFLTVGALIVLLPVVFAFTGRRGKGIHIWVGILAVISTFVLLFVSSLFDFIFGVSESWLFTLVIGVIGLFICTAVYSRFRSRLVLLIGSVVVVFVLAQHFMDWTPVKPYRRFFAAVQPGMAEAEVMAAVKREFPSNGRFSEPVLRYSSSTNMSFFLETNASAFNAEGVFLQMTNGRVVAKEYMRD